MVSSAIDSELMKQGMDQAVARNGGEKYHC